MKFYQMHDSFNVHVFALLNIAGHHRLTCLAADLGNLAFKLCVATAAAELQACRMECACDTCFVQLLYVI